MNREVLKMKISAIRFWIVVSKGVASEGAGISLLEKSIREGENPVFALQTFTYGTFLTSRVPWDWSANLEVNFF